MTVYKLIQEHKRNFSHSHFFDKETLRFFGERISEMYVLKKTEMIDGVEYYVLSSLQHNAPGGARRAYHYFDVNTFELK